MSAPRGMGRWVLVSLLLLSSGAAFGDPGLEFVPAEWIAGDLVVLEGGEFRAIESDGVIVSDSPTWDGDYSISGLYVALARPESDRLERTEAYYERIRELVGPEPTVGPDVPRRYVDPLEADSAETADEEEAGSDLAMCGVSVVPQQQGVENEVSPSSLCSTYDEKLFGSDNRVAVTAPYGYPYTKFPVVFVASIEEDDPDWVGQCSGVFLDATTVLTAAHCIYDTAAGAWYWGRYGVKGTEYGIDSRQGYVCIQNGHSAPRQSWDFADECEFVTDRYVPIQFVNGVTSNAVVEYDFAILKVATDNFPNGIGNGNWVAMSAIDSPSILAQKTPVSHGYPGYAPGGVRNKDLTYLAKCGLGMAMCQATGPEQSNTETWMAT